MRCEVITGTERLLSGQTHLVHGRKVGLVTNHSGVDGRLQATADRLHESGSCRLAALFGPEHGIRGDAADGAPVPTSKDPVTGVTVHSLYGDANRPDAAALAELDLLLFDIQDVGARFYTYLYTMTLSMGACAEAGIPFVVLDRPNPVGGVRLGGCLLAPDFASFVGLYPVPIQYGLTIGEFARLANEHYGIGADLTVVTMSGWQRRMFWEDTGLPWVPPSPNMPTPDTAVVYPGTCLFEGTNVSEGRGTTRPFEQIGAPWIDGHRLADLLNGLELAGARFRPVHFRPTTSKHRELVCQGVQVHVVDRHVYDPVRTGLEMVAAIRHLWPAHFAWHLPATGIYNFDRLAGTDAVRLALETATPVADIVAAWSSDLQDYVARSRDCMLYD
jgi:uncharacterized protein YbbC (DUF1343 family)